MKTYLLAKFGNEDHIKQLQQGKVSIDSKKIGIYGESGQSIVYDSGRILYRDLSDDEQ